jgi:hypothetical protein
MKVSWFYVKFARHRAACGPSILKSGPGEEESDPAYEDLGSRKYEHRKRRALEGDQRDDPERNPTEDEQPGEEGIVHEGQPPQRPQQYRWQGRPDDSDRDRDDDGE